MLSYTCFLMAALILCAAFVVTSAPFSALFSGLAILLLCFSLKCKMDDAPAETKQVAGELS